MAATRFADWSTSKKLVVLAATAAAFVLGALAASALVKRFAGPGASFDRAVESEPNFAPVRAMRDKLPDDYARLRAEMLAMAEAGRPMPEIERAGFAWMRDFMAVNRPAMARAPSAQLAAFRRGQIDATEALAGSSVEQCARFSMGSLSPTDRPSAAVQPVIQRAATAQVEAVAAGRSAPPKPAPSMAQADAVALVEGMKAQGLSDALVARFTGPAGMAAASPAEQCEVGRKLLQALNELPTAQADRITAFLITQS